MGRVRSSAQNTGGQNYIFGYTYNLAGAQTSETYPSQRTVSVVYDGANRVDTVTGNSGTTATSYIKVVGYYPQGAPIDYTC